MAIHTISEAKALALKWYRKLGILPEREGEFIAALENADLALDVDIMTFVDTKPEGVEALCKILYHCEALSERYREAGIDEQILLDTLHDIRIYCEEWTAVKGVLTTGTTNWLRRHFGFDLFRLGRLQFGMTKCWGDFPDAGLMKGDPTCDVHIPRGDKMTPEVCRASFRAARAFFAKYFPDYKYKYFTCYSWLLDASLSEFLPEDSNIIRFGNMFRRIHTAEVLGMLDYLYPIGTKKEDLPHVTPGTRFAAAIKDAILADRKFYASYGVIAPEEVDAYGV